MKKPWPSDAIIIVCSKPGDENRSNMDSCHDGECRDCGTAIVYDGRSYRSAIEMDCRDDRPVDFLCIECYVKYDAGSIDELIDHRAK